MPRSLPTRYDSPLSTLVMVSPAANNGNDGPRTAVAVRVVAEDA
jgi:hypothetical protein